MKRRMRAAVVSVVIISVITALKFFSFWLSDSIAVYSESWHSFMDVATSLLVLVSIRFGLRKKISDGDVVDSDKDAAADSSSGRKQRGVFRQIFSRAHPEVLVSLTIGLVLIGLSGFILYNVFYAVPVAVSYPLVVGLLFILLSVFSYFLYRFQRTMAEEEESAALEADSSHSRADMIISVFTGFSLVLYYFNIDIDKIAGAVIAVFIFSFSFELFLSSLLALFRGEDRITRRYGFNSVVLLLFDPAFWTTTFSRLAAFFRVNDHLRERMHRLLFVFLPRAVKYGFLAGIAVVTLWWGRTCLFSVAPEQVAYRIRFGAVIDREDPLGPGLHVKMPWPIDDVIKFRTKRLYSVNIGNSGTSGVPMIWSKKHGDQRKFISGDNNFLLPYITVVFSIRNPYRYYYVHRDPEALMRDSITGVLNAEFVGSSFYRLIVHGRQEWSRRVLSRSQEIMNELRIGIQLEDIHVKDVHPPLNVAASFENVVAAEQIKQKRINISGKYRENLLSRKQSRALKNVLEAESYRFRRTMTAEGKASQHNNIYRGYRSAPQVMRYYLKMRRIRELLADSDLLVYDPKSGVNHNMFYMQEYIRGGGGE